MNSKLIDQGAKWNVFSRWVVVAVDDSRPGELVALGTDADMQVLHMHLFAKALDESMHTNAIVDTGGSHGW